MQTQRTRDFPELLFRNREADTASTALVVPLVLAPPPPFPSQNREAVDLRQARTRALTLPPFDLAVLPAAVASLTPLTCRSHRSLFPELPCCRPPFAKLPLPRYSARAPLPTSVGSLTTSGCHRHCNQMPKAAVPAAIPSSARPSESPAPPPPYCWALLYSTPDRSASTPNRSTPSLLLSDAPTADSPALPGRALCHRGRPQLPLLPWPFSLPCRSYP
ncbi:hypothetical protein ACJRO7_034110, partial [Eucalyptus globulus]